MKKVFYSLCAIVACTCVWVACSDDDSFEKSRELTNKERLEKIIQKYDVNFVLNDSILSTDISDAELVEFEGLIKALSGIRGTCKLHADSDNGGTYLGTQMEKPLRNKRLANSNEVVIYENHGYNGQTIADNYRCQTFYTCSCSLHWKKVDSTIQWVKVFPTIDFDHFGGRYTNYSIRMRDNDYDTFISSDSTFHFNGVYHGDVLYNSTNYGYTTFLYDGFMLNSHDGSISWQHIYTDL